MTDSALPEPRETPLIEPAPVLQRGAAQPATRPAPAPRRGGSGGAIFFSLLLSAALAAAGYYGWTHPSPDVAAALDDVGKQAQAASTQAGQAAGQVAGLSQQAAAFGPQLQSLSDRLDRLEKAAAQPPAAPPPQAADLGDLPKRVDDLTSRIEALANRPAPASASTAPAPADPGPATAALAQSVAELNQRTARAIESQKEAAAQALDAQKAELAQALEGQKAALTQLSMRLDQLAPRLNTLEQGIGRAKGSEADTTRLARIQAALAALQAGKPLGDIPGAPPALAQFASAAPPSEAKLRESFPVLAERARRVSQPDLKGRTIWQRALTRLQSAVTVRQGPDVLVGDPAAGILDDAGAKVQSGDLAGAVGVLHHLTGPAAAAMQGWMNDVGSLLAARAALADLAARG